MSENINLEDIRKLSEEVNSLVNSGMIPLNDGTKKVVDKFTNLADAVSKVEMQNFGKSVKRVSDALDDVTDATKDLIEKEEKLADEFGLLTGGALKKFGKELLGATGEFLSAMNSVSNGTGKYARSVEHIGRATKDLASNFGTYGEMAGWSAEKMAEFAAASLKQNDVLNKAFENLAKFGQIDTTNFRTMLDQFHQAGFGLADAETYIQSVNRTASELAMFGTTAAKGRQAFDNVLSEMVLNEEERTRYMRMGYSVQDIIDNSASVMASVSLSARGMKLDTAALHKITSEYLETQAELTSLTGANRDDAMKARRTQEDDVAFQMHLARLSKTETGRQQAEQQRNLAGFAGRELGREAQMAIQQTLRGNTFSPEAAKLYRVGGPESIQQIIDAGNVTGPNRSKAIIDSMNTLSKGILASGEMYETNVSASRTGTMPSMFMTGETYKGATKLSNLDSNELKEFTRMLNERPKDDRRKELSELYSRELEFKQVTDKATYAMGEVAVKSITSLAGAADSATAALSKLADKAGFTDNWKPNKTSGGKTQDTSSNRTPSAAASGQNAPVAALEGIPMKAGAHTREQLDARLAEIMQKVSKEIPGFNRVTAVNDRTDPGSMHSKGKAFDFTINKPTPENLDAAIQILRNHGLKVADEYRYPIPGKTTGPHLHASLQGRTGGIFSGPNTGYQVELHGKEAVIPMSNLKSMLGDKSKGDDSVTKHMLSNPGTASSSPMTHSDSGMLRQLMNLLVGRLDDMIYELQAANGASAKIAKNTKK